jgi:hypothetical protein
LIWQKEHAVQDKVYVIAIVIVLGICCLGIYVAISGYLNSNPSAFPSIVSGSSGTPIFIAFNTDTPGPTNQPTTLVIVPTVVPVPSPLGAFQTITAAVTLVAPTQAPTILRPLPSPTTGSSAGMPPCGSSPFCPRTGPPDFDLAPGGQGDCPRNYLWGRVVGLDGRGLRDRKLRFKNPINETDTVTTKAPPDPEGRYDIVGAIPNSTWTLWLLDGGGGDASPRVTLNIQIYTGVGNCPTRIDFVQQR